MDNDKRQRLVDSTDQFTAALIETADELRKEIEKKMDKNDMDANHKLFLENGLGAMGDVSKEFEEKKKELQATLKAMQKKFSNF